MNELLTKFFKFRTYKYPVCKTKYVVTYTTIKATCLAFPLIPFYFLDKVLYQI